MSDYYYGEGANGGCYFDISQDDRERDGIADLRVGWSCVGVHNGDIPVTWLAEIIAIATGWKGGVPGFLREFNGDESYALMCDPEEKK